MSFNLFFYRKGSLEPQNLSKRFASSSSGSKAGSVGRPEKNNASKVQFTPRKQWRKSKDMPPRSRSDSTSSEKDMQQPQIRTQPRRMKPSKYDSIVLVDSTEEIKNRLKPVVFPRNQKLNVFYTDVMYYVPPNTTEPIELSPKKPEKKVEDGVQGGLLDIFY